MESAVEMFTTATKVDKKTTMVVMSALMAITMTNTIAMVANMPVKSIYDIFRNYSSFSLKAIPIPSSDDDNNKRCHSRALCHTENDDCSIPVAGAMMVAAWR